MTIDQATAILREMRRAAPAGEVAIQAILFGIKYHDPTRRCEPERTL